MINKIKVFEFLSLNKNYTIIGSNSDNKLKYSTDYDLQEIIEKTSPLEILKKFQSKFEYAKKTKSFYIIDFKSGIHNTIPIRWNYTDIMNGYQTIDNEIIKFENTLSNNFDSVINNVHKLDLTVFFNSANGNEYHEFSCNYYFQSNNSNNLDTYEIYKSLLIDVKKYYFEGKFMKLLKRIYSYLRIKNDNNNESIETLVNLFNSDAGLLNQLEHKINVIIEVKQNNFKPVDVKELKIAMNNLKNIIPAKYIKYIDNLDLLQKTIHDDINLKVIDFVNNLL